MEAVPTFDTGDARTGAGQFSQDFAKFFSGRYYASFVALAMPTGGEAEDRDLRAADAESLIAPDDGED